MPNSINNKYKIVTSTSLTGTAHLRVSLSFALDEVVVLGSTSEDRPFTATHTNRSFSKMSLRGFDLEKRPLVLNSNCITSSSRNKKRPEDEPWLEFALSFRSEAEGRGVDSFPVKIKDQMSIKIIKEI